MSFFKVNEHFFKNMGNTRHGSILWPTIFVSDKCYQTTAFGFFFILHCSLNDQIPNTYNHADSFISLIHIFWLRLVLSNNEVYCEYKKSEKINGLIIN